MFHSNILFKTFLINLENDVHKYNRFHISNYKINIPFKIWRGVVINSKPQFDNLKKIFPFMGGCKDLIKRGNIGAACAHLSLWKYCLCLPDEYFLIMEDNCLLNDQFVTNLENIWNKLKNQDVHFFNLNVLRPSGELLFTENNINISKMIYIDKLKEPLPNVWLSCYIISKKIIPFLLKNLSHIDFNHNIIDREVTKVINSNLDKFNCYYCQTNKMVTHKESVTDSRKIFNNCKLNKPVNNYHVSFRPIDHQFTNVSIQNIINILSINHIHGEKDLGKYFHFNNDNNYLQIDNKNIFSIINSRTFRHGQVLIWNVNNNGGLIGNAHGRFTNNQSNNDFKVGDILYINKKE